MVSSFRCVMLVLLAAMANNLLADAPTSQRPNVLFMFLDDFGWRDCGFMGTDYYETPNLDALAQGGMVFTNAYAGAANCAPSRACLLSGQYSPRHQIYNVGTSRRGNPKFGSLMHVPGVATLSPQTRTWAHCIQDAGYETATIGKWHLSKDPLPYGFDLNVGGSHSGSPPRGYFPPHPGAPGLNQAAKNEYLTDRLTDEALHFIRQHQSQPWFLYLTHFAVHTPLQAKPKLLEKYDHKPAGELHDSAVMAAMIQSVDEGVGRIVKTLSELNLADKTAIVFTSDNGGYGPATSMRPLKGYKGTYYEGGIRVPLFVHWPGVVEAGATCDVPVINVDLYPTFCELTEAPAPVDQPADGVSLLPLLRSDRATADRLANRALYWHFPAYLQSYQRFDEQRDPLFRSRPCSIVRSGDWKLHEYFEDGGLELYNLKDDVGERVNLAEQNPTKLTEMHQLLVRWRQSIEAPVPREPNPNYDPAAEAAAIKKMRGKR